MLKEAFFFLSSSNLVFHRLSHFHFILFYSSFLNTSTSSKIVFLPLSNYVMLFSVYLFIYLLLFFLFARSLFRE